LSFHSFDPEIATITKSILAAVVYEYILTNSVRDDGFMRMSIKSSILIFPYATEKQVRNAIAKLLKFEMIEKRFLAYDQTDRTAYYRAEI